MFQSLTRDSNHSNQLERGLYDAIGFNPSRGIAIIQTSSPRVRKVEVTVSIPHAG